MSVDQSFSQVNKSLSKQSYSFSKAQRIGSTAKPYCQSIYETPSTLKKRSTTLGLGQRNYSQYIKDGPAPGAYESVYETLNFQKMKNKGFTMGMSREKVFSQGNFRCQEQTPGPAVFLPKSTLSQIGYSVCGRIKHGVDAVDKEKAYIPGPGQYVHLPQMNSDGKYIVSKMRNVTGTKFSQSTGKRFIKAYRDDIPGVGTYKSGIPQNKEGKYSVSNVRNIQNTVINRHQEIQSVSNFIIGPGSYEIPSEFGQYKKIK